MHNLGSSRSKPPKDYEQRLVLIGIAAAAAFGFLYGFGEIGWRVALSWL